MKVTGIDSDKLAEPPLLGLRVHEVEGKSLCTVEVGEQDVEVISVRLDEALLPRMSTWLYLRVAVAVRALLHSCGDGTGWREVDEGAVDFTIRSDIDAKGYMTFECLRCASTHRMKGSGEIEWGGMAVED